MKNLPSGKDAPKLKSDRYRKVRGGSAEFLTLYCAKCGNWLIWYQKDGSGSLLRCYLNRIVAPDELEKLQHSDRVHVPKDLAPLICTHCNALVGLPTRHVDGRLAYRLVRGAVSKTKGLKLPQ